VSNTMEFLIVQRVYSCCKGDEGTLRTCTGECYRYYCYKVHLCNKNSYKLTLT